MNVKYRVVIEPTGNKPHRYFRSWFPLFNWHLEEWVVPPGKDGFWTKGLSAPPTVLWGHYAESSTCGSCNSEEEAIEQAKAAIARIEQDFKEYKEQRAAIKYVEIT